MTNWLLLTTGADIPFVEAQLIIHQPTILEISLISEEKFFSGVHLLAFAKNTVDNGDLANFSDFDIIIRIVNNKDATKSKNAIKLVLALLFPNSYINFSVDEIILENTENKLISKINQENYDIFKNVLIKMFDLKENDSNAKYNPDSLLANKIAEKFKSREKILNKKKNTPDKDNQDIAILSQYIAYLSIWYKRPMYSFNNYTVWQLTQEYKRARSEESFINFIEAKKLGSKDIEDVPYWMEQYPMK